jgi:hypothetical protein
MSHLDLNSFEVVVPTTNCKPAAYSLLPLHGWRPYLFAIAVALLIAGGCS